MSRTVKKFDSADIDSMLTELRFPAIRESWRIHAERSDSEGWPAAQLIAVLAEDELAGRKERRISRNIVESELLPGKTLDTFDFKLVPMVSKAQVMAMSLGDDWIRTGSNLALFGPPGVGKSHLACAIGRSLVDHGYRVLFVRTTKIVQKLQLAMQGLSLESALRKLDKYHLLILDDFAYGHRDRDECSVLLELIGYRYENRSLMITSNKPYSSWEEVFPDKTTALSAVDRFDHHATRFEMNVESYRRRKSSGKSDAGK